jgi:TRAP-type uncharacterized transport system fused permease subunit
VFAAAAIAKANMWHTGVEAMRIAAAGFIVPFMFVYEPALLAIGDWGSIALATMTATVGVMALAACLYGYLLAPTTLWQRLLLAAAAILLIKPGLVTDMIGLGLLGFVAAMQLLAVRRLARGGA